MRRYYIILILFMFLLHASCSKNETREYGRSEYYTCPMHPSVRSDRAGACPVCGMALVKAEGTKGVSEQHTVGSNSLMFDEEKQMLANISVDTVRIGSIGPETMLSGKVTANENEVNTITARVSGRIDRLFLRQPGEQISRNQPLYSIYSEQLLADQNDYLSALGERKKFPGQESTINDLIKAGRKKLQLWGMTEQQIKELEKDKEISALLTYYSPYNGFVTRLLINEGEYTEIGKPLFQVADLASVWVEAQLYANEIKSLTDRPDATIVVEAFPYKAYKGTLVFESPSLEENSKVNLVRFYINNGDNRLKPGMMARVTIHHKKKQALVIPKSALLIGSMKMVWIESGDDMFESRIVKTGIENKKFAEVLSGVQEGDLIVTSGAYLLNSEFILKKGAVKAHSH